MPHEKDDLVKIKERMMLKLGSCFSEKEIQDFVTMFYAILEAHEEIEEAENDIGLNASDEAEYG